MLSQFLKEKNAITLNQNCKIKAENLLQRFNFFFQFHVYLIDKYEKNGILDKRE